MMNYHFDYFYNLKSELIFFRKLNITFDLKKNDMLYERVQFLHLY
jgi:hypothetical protein